MIKKSSESSKTKGRRDSLVILFYYLMVPEFYLMRKIKGIVVIAVYGVGRRLNYSSKNKMDVEATFDQQIGNCESMFCRSIIPRN